MARLQLSKSALSREQKNLKTYERFLPSLDLKRQQVMAERNKAARQLAHESEDARHALQVEAVCPEVPADGLHLPVELLPAQCREVVLQSVDRRNDVAVAGETGLASVLQAPPDAGYRTWYVALSSSILSSFSGRRMQPNPRMESSSPFFGIFRYNIFLLL